MVLPNDGRKEQCFTAETQSSRTRQNRNTENTEEKRERTKNANCSEQILGFGKIGTERLPV